MATKGKRCIESQSEPPCPWSPTPPHTFLRAATVVRSPSPRRTKPPRAQPPRCPTVSRPRLHLHHHTAPLVRSLPPAFYAKQRPCTFTLKRARPPRPPSTRVSPYLHPQRLRPPRRWATDCCARVPRRPHPPSARARPPKNFARRTAAPCFARHTHARTSTSSYRPLSPPPPSHRSTHSLATAGPTCSRARRSVAQRGGRCSRGWGGGYNGSVGGAF